MRIAQSISYHYRNLLIEEQPLMTSKKSTKSIAKTIQKTNKEKQTPASGRGAFFAGKRVRNQELTGKCCHGGGKCS